MRFAFYVLLLSAVAISAELDSESQIQIAGRDFRGTPEFQDIVNYLEYNVSPSDIKEILEALPEALEGPTEDAEEQNVAVPMPRSVGSVVVNAFQQIPWSKITDYLQKMAKSNSKFTKVLNLINDTKFCNLIKKAVNSHTLGEFVKDVAEHGFSCTDFLHLLLEALCSTATTIQHDKYTADACQILNNL